ncbi:MAG: chemotaxis protein [Pseudomonadota bacterium]
MKYLITLLLMPMLVLLWVAVQHAARRFAARHPEFGPAREEGEEGCGGCGGGGHCSNHCVSSAHHH